MTSERLRLMQEQRLIKAMNGPINNPEMLGSIMCGLNKPIRDAVDKGQTLFNAKETAFLLGMSPTTFRRKYKRFMPFTPEGETDIVSIVRFPIFYTHFLTVNQPWNPTLFTMLEDHNDKELTQLL